MKSLKVILTAIALSVLASAPLAAQQKKGGGMTVERIEQAVGTLTSAQKEKIQAILAKTSEAMKGIAKEDRKVKGAELQKKQREDINKVLTADQRAKWEEAMAAAKKRN